MGYTHMTTYMGSIAYWNEFKILNIVCNAPQGIKFSDIVTKSGLGDKAVANNTQELAENGFIEKAVGKFGLYYITANGNKELARRSGLHDSNNMKFSQTHVAKTESKIAETTSTIHVANISRELKQLEIEALHNGQVPNSLKNNTIFITKVINPK